MPSSLTGQRWPSFRYVETSPSGVELRVISDVIRDGGRVEFGQQDQIRGSGDLSRPLARAAVGVNSIRIKYVLDAGTPHERSWPVATMMTTSPESDYDSGLATSAVEMYDGTLILVQDAIEGTLFIPANTPVTDEVGMQLRHAGVPGSRIAITGSPKTLAADMSFPPGTTRLKIVNDLLDAIDYFAIFTDGNGVFRAEPYRDPRTRPVAWTFRDGEASVHAYPMRVDDDTYSIPNKVIAISRTDGKEAALVATATITDPTNEYHYDNLGRWRTEVLRDLEVAGQPRPEDREATQAELDEWRAGVLAELDKRARRRLREAGSVARTVHLQHGWLPIGINDVVELDVAGIRGLFTVISQAIPLDPGKLVTTTLREAASE